MRHPAMLDIQGALLLIIDVQERFRKVLPDFAGLAGNISTLAKACNLLQLPAMVTEQYPQGLGRTVSEITEALGTYERFEKASFSSCAAPGFMEALSRSACRHIMVCGIEAHVCVNQTVHDLLSRDYKVHLIVDSISARHEKNKEIGIEKMIRSGAYLSSVEMALFEMLMCSGTETFKAVQKLVK